jgi:hypothetical protein
MYVVTETIGVVETVRVSANAGRQGGSDGRASGKRLRGA